MDFKFNGPMLSHSNLVFRICWRKKKIEMDFDQNLPFFQGAVLVTPISFVATEGFSFQFLPSLSNFNTSICNSCTSRRISPRVLGRFSWRLWCVERITYNNRCGFTRWCIG